MKADFEGWATRTNLKCSDGKTIRPGAFRKNHNKKVPLVWMHQRKNQEAVLGHAILEHRDEGTRVKAYFNDTTMGRTAKEQVEHGDVSALSIHANRLRMLGQDVLDGDITEVSLVVAGANPGAYIDHVSLSHGEDDDFEAIIYTGLEIEHSEEGEDVTSQNMTVGEKFNSFSPEDQQFISDLVDSALDHAGFSEDDELEHAEMTVADKWNSFSEEDKRFIAFLVSEMSGDDNEGEEGEEDVEHSRKGNGMTFNVFDRVAEEKSGLSLQHGDIMDIIEDAKRPGMTLKRAVEGYLEHADGDYGIGDIDLLFPEAQLIRNEPDKLQHKTEWVRGVLDSVHKSPLANVKSLFTDLTTEEARARGYIKGTEKVDEFIELQGRKTSPTTVYKKQKLDRDDVVDIVSFDVVVWLKAEMRMMLELELARAILIGDGRAISADGKIKEPRTSGDGAGVRSILNDHALYAPKITIPVNTNNQTLVDELTKSLLSYEGTGSPTLYASRATVTNLMVTRDGENKREYKSVEELASTIGVARIIQVDIMNVESDLVGIIVNLADYTLGTNQGGQTSFFDDFDLDFNQFKYLYEARLSGALTLPKSAVVVKYASAPPTP